MVKKSFKDNPALQFMSTPEVEPEEDVVVAPKEFDVPMKLNPLYIETKSRRLQLLMQPSLHAKLKDISKNKGVSLNELIHTVLEDYAKGE